MRDFFNGTAFPRARPAWPSWYLAPMLELLLLLVRTLVALLRSRRDLVLENLVLHHQLQVALRTSPRPSVHDRDRILWTWLRRLWPSGWRVHLVMVRPDTVIRWHAEGGGCTGPGGPGRAWADRA